MTRGPGRLGYGSVSTPFTPTILNTAYPFSQKFFPASEMTLVGLQQPIRQDITIAAQNKTYNVITFAQGVDQRASWVWSFQEGKMDVVTPDFRWKPIWFQDQDEVDPGTNALWSMGSMNTLLGTTLDAAFPGGTDVVMGTENEYELSGITGGLSEVLALSGDALSATLINTLEMYILRSGSQGSDTFLGPAHLLGIAIQYANDFNNVAQWDLISPT